MSYKFYTKEEKEARADLIKQVKKEINVAEIASNLYGLKILQAKKGGRYLKCVEHSSMVFDLGRNCVYWNAQSGNTPLNVIDFIMMYENISAPSAIHKAIEYYQERDGRDLDLFIYNYQENTVQTTRGLILPKENENNINVHAYLTSVRGLKEQLVSDLMQQKLLYEDINNNCVFVGYDKELKPSFACVRGTRERKYQMDCSGSRKSVGFYLETEYTIKKLALFESVIDGLSYASLNTKLDANILCASGAGNVLQTLNYHLLERKRNEIEEIMLCLDNDDAGHEASKKIKEWMKEFYPKIKVSEYAYEGKDVNEYLLVNIREAETKELEAQLHDNFQIALNKPTKEEIEEVQEMG